MSSQSFFHVIYDGPALENNEMDVRDLAPALIALSDLFDEANKVLNEGKVELSTHVKASFKTGCFGIEIGVVQGIASSIKSMFQDDPITSAATLVTLVGFLTVKDIGKGLLGLLKWLKGRDIQEVMLLENGRVKVTIDNDHYETEKKIIDLYRNERIRKALEAAIYKPLQRDGINSFGCAENMPAQGDDFFSISKEESEFFTVIEPEDELLEEVEYDAHVQAVNIAFQDDNKWRFTDGSHKFFAEMKDTGFIERIQNNKIAFRKDDLLKVKILKTQKLTAHGLKPEYQILKVIEHRSAARQMDLPFDGLIDKK